MSKIQPARWIMIGITTTKEVQQGAYMVQQGQYHGESVDTTTFISCCKYWVQVDSNTECILVIKDKWFKCERIKCR